MIIVTSLIESKDEEAPAPNNINTPKVKGMDIIAVQNHIQNPLLVVLRNFGLPNVIYQLIHRSSSSPAKKDVGASIAHG